MQKQEEAQKKTIDSAENVGIPPTLEIDTDDIPLEMTQRYGIFNLKLTKFLLFILVVV